MKRFSNALLFFQRDIGLRLLVLYILFVGPLILGALFANNLASERLENEIRASDQDLASVISQELQSYLLELFELVDQLAHHSSVVNLENEGITELFQTLAIGRDSISAIYMLDISCTAVYGYRPGIGDEQSDLPSSRFESLCNERIPVPILTKGHISALSGQPVATIAHPIYSIIEDKTIGWVAVDIRLNSINKLVRLSVQHRPDEKVEVILIDNTGQIVARSDYDPQRMLISGTEELQQLASLRSETTNFSWVGPNNFGDEHLYTSVFIDSIGWSVLLSRPTELAFSTLKTFSQGVYASVLLFVIVGLFFWLFLYRNIILPLEQVSEHSQEIVKEEQQGDSGLNIDVSNLDRKITTLQSRQDQIGQLVQNLVRAEEMIADRFEELETLLETGAVVLSSLDLRVVLNLILEQVERLMGLDKSAIIALDEKRGVFRSQASRGLSQRYTEQVAIQPGEPASITLKALESGQPEQIADTDPGNAFAAYRPRAQREGIRAMIAVPFEIMHGPPTTLLVYHSEPHKFSPREINLLTSFAQQAAMALENATLFNRSDAKVQEQTLRLEALIQSMRDGLIMEDLDGRVIYANRMAEELTGLTQFQAKGKDVNELFERILMLAREPDKTRKAIQIAQALEENQRVDLEINDFKGARLFLRMRFFIVTDEDGARIGRGRILHDITRRRELDRMRSSLISTVSHELRTPLASIKGYATTLLSEDVEWDIVSQREFLTIISEETDRLSELVKDLLDMSRIEAGNLSISRVNTDLNEMISRAAQRVRTPPGDRLKLSIDPGVPVLYIDPQRMEVVFRNLIENAIKYSSDNSLIYIEIGVEENAVLVRVEDEGPGIPPIEQHRIFESFYRVESGLSRSTQGAGLGLAICQGFVRAHGGKIWYEERGKGSCIAFSLPLDSQNTQVSI